MMSTPGIDGVALADQRGVAGVKLAPSDSNHTLDGRARLTGTGGMPVTPPTCTAPRLQQDPVEDRPAVVTFPAIWKG